MALVSSFDGPSFCLILRLAVVIDEDLGILVSHLECLLLLGDSQLNGEVSRCPDVFQDHGLAHEDPGRTCRPLEALALEQFAGLKILGMRHRRAHGTQEQSQGGEPRQSIQIGLHRTIPFTGVPLRIPAHEGGA